ncbi:sulfate adenylyltransferase subunit CysD [Amycolatopsis thailandensis]|uniref:sulfate adenylyltransferase subunit CysD n=1 Tax=Amycolatopsis thailandensis TaxID=589330 RepID=UPI003656AF89
MNRPASAIGAATTRLAALVDESVHIIREVAGQFRRQALLFSGGKDSMVLLDLTRRAFRPCALPFPLLHVDTGTNFGEVLEFRDRVAAAYGAELIVASVQRSIESGRAKEKPGGTRNRLQSVTLRDAITENGFDALLAGARRDEEKARAKERVFSIRDEFARWDPRRQRPELWEIYNGRLRRGEHARVFPLSNWTEADIWTYVAEYGIDLPELYFARERLVVERSGRWVAVTEHTPAAPGERAIRLPVRYRTVGDATCTAAVRSTAGSPAEVLRETLEATVSERAATRLDDRDGDFAMEDRKREGYF